MGQSLGYTDDLSFYNMSLTMYRSTPLTSDPTLLGMTLCSPSIESVTVTC